MTDREHEHDLKPVAGAVYGLAGAGAVALIVGFAAFAAPRPADALPAYAQQTGLACGRCHVNPAGGGRAHRIRQCLRGEWPQGALKGGEAGQKE